MTEEVARKLAELPDSPGCYLMKQAGNVIYVGKAKNLKNRVRQYFHASASHSPKVEAMVERVDDFEIVLVDGELEALILECNLIKLHRPFYNILLKDDKHYPYIRLNLREPYPRPELVRKPEKDGAKYFGPYFSATVVREVLDVVRQTFPVRTCTRTIVPGKRQRPCVHAEIGQCLAPCAGDVSVETYRAAVDKVAQFLGGDYDPVLRELEEKMRSSAASMNYERASVYRDRLRAVEQIMQKQKAIVAGGGDQDVIALLLGGDDALAQVLTVRGGKMIGSETRVLEQVGDEPNGAVMTSFLTQYYAEEQPPREVLLSDEPDEAETLERLLSEKRGTKVALSTPQRGDKRRLVEMAMKNARDARQKREARLQSDYTRTVGALTELADALELGAPPTRIECYDISNTQGVLSVGSMVVMKRGLTSPKDYRHFRIKTVEGPDDFASMKEVIGRRFRHGLEERAAREEAGQDPDGGKFSELPDLVVIDGGRGQLNAAREALSEVGVTGQAIVGLAKRIEEIVLPDCDETLLLDRHSPALHLLQRLRDEAHRFAITHHRKLRASAEVISQLDALNGIGPKKRKALMTRFESLEALRAASVAEIAEAEGFGEKSAQALYDQLHEEKRDKEE